jgi:glycosyltransferase involved in cell wall biosynthesis
MYRKLIVIAYSIYPDYKSSEGIVNYNWIKILLKHTNNIVQISQKKSVDFVKNKTVVFKVENYFYKAIKKESIVSYLVYKALNFLFCVLSSGNSLYNYLWINKTSRFLEKHYTSDAVIWSRILPTNSLNSILSLHSKKQFPFVVNINDPIIISDKQNGANNFLTAEEKTLLETRDIAQAWTFPSSKLADRMAAKYKLDRKRCFVVPHAITPFVDRYYRKNDKIKILYTGTFYKSAFNQEFKHTLEQIKRHEVSEKLEFTFVLSQYNQESIEWLKETIPDVNLLFNLDRSDVLELLKSSDLMLVIDAESHIDLLKGKLVEAISYGVPIYTPTYKGSIMDKVTSKYGCNSSYLNIKGDSLKSLLEAIDNLDDNDWLTNFYNQREEVIEQFSEEKILKMTYDISEFAHNRFFDNHNFKLTENYNWP